jgi:hypothetical protein
MSDYSMLLSGLHRETGLYIFCKSWCTCLVHDHSWGQKYIMSNLGDRPFFNHGHTRRHKKTDDIYIYLVDLFLFDLYYYSSIYDLYILKIASSNYFVCNHRGY